MRGQLYFIRKCVCHYEASQPKIKIDQATNSQPPLSNSFPATTAAQRWSAGLNNVRQILSNQMRHSKTRRRRHSHIGVARARASRPSPGSLSAPRPPRPTAPRYALGLAGLRAAPRLRVVR